MEPDEYGDWCWADDADDVRRRLLVKLCRERAEARLWIYGEEKVSTVGFFDDLAVALESNQPLTYFQRLGEDK